MTNGDRIREMSDDKLGRTICKQIRVCCFCPGYPFCKRGDGLGNGMIKWLKQEARKNGCKNGWRR